MSTVRIDTTTRSIGLLGRTWNRGAFLFGSNRLFRDVFRSAMKGNVEINVSPTILIEVIGVDCDIFPGSADYARALSSAGVVSISISKGTSIDGIKTIFSTMVTSSLEDARRKLEGIGATFTFIEPKTSIRRGDFKYDDPNPISGMNTQGETDWDIPEWRGKIEAQNFEVPRAPYHPHFSVREFAQMIGREHMVSPFRGREILAKVQRENPALYSEMYRVMGQEFIDEIKGIKKS